MAVGDPRLLSSPAPRGAWLGALWTERVEGAGLVSLHQRRELHCSPPSPAGVGTGPHRMHLAHGWCDCAQRPVRCPVGRVGVELTLAHTGRAASSTLCCLCPSPAQSPSETLNPPADVQRLPRVFFKPR